MVGGLVVGHLVVSSWLIDALNGVGLSSYTRVVPVVGSLLIILVLWSGVGHSCFPDVVGLFLLLLLLLLECCRSLLLFLCPYVAIDFFFLLIDALNGVVALIRFDTPVVRCFKWCRIGSGTPSSYLSRDRLFFFCCCC